MTPSDPEGSSAAPSEEVREYGYPRTLWLQAVLDAMAFFSLLAAACFMFLDSFFLLDTSCLAFWPLGLRSLFYLFCALLAVVFVGLPALFLRQSLLVLKHRHDRVRLDDRGVILLCGDTETLLPWEHVSVSRGITYLCVRAQEREWRLPVGFADEGNMMRDIEQRGSSWRTRADAYVRANLSLSWKSRFGGAYGLLAAAIGVILLALGLLLPGLTLPGLEDPLLPPMDPWARLLLVVISLGCLAWSAILFLPLRLATFQLLPEEFQHRTWYGRVRSLPYRSLLALQWSQASKWKRARELGLHYHDTSGRERTLTFESNAEHQILLDTLRQELVRRGELVPAPEGRVRGAEVWEKRGGNESGP